MKEHELMMAHGAKQQRGMAYKIAEGVGAKRLSKEERRIAEQEDDEEYDAPSAQPQKRAELKIEGFWSSNNGKDGLPVPKPYTRRWIKDSLLQALIVVEDKAESTHYKGWSTCRICKCKNGSGEYSYNGWKWPSGLYHYINVHKVRPSKEFEEFIMEQSQIIKGKSSKATHKTANTSRVKKTQRASTSDVRKRKTSNVRSDLPFNVVKDRKQWQMLRDKVQTSDTWADFLSNLYDMLITPRTCVFVATKFDANSGDPIDGKWKKSSDFNRTRVFHYPRNGYCEGLKLPKFVVIELQKYFEYFARGNGPIVYMSPVLRKGAPARAITISSEYVSTGGGHNDSVSYDYAIRIEPVSSILNILSGAPLGEA